MAATPPRVLVLSEIPTPYRLPLYRLLARSGAVSLEVVFLAEGEPDRPWQLDDLFAEVPHRVLKGVAPRIRTRRNTFVYELNPGILRLLRSEPWDVVVIGGYAVFAEQVAIAWAQATRTPYVLHSESHLGKPRRRTVRAAKSLVVPRVVRGAAAGLAVGTRAARYLEAYGMPPGRIRIVPNTVDVAAFRARAEAARGDAAGWRARLGLPERFLLFAGRLVEAKGLLDLLRALDTLGDDSPMLIVAGDGPLRDEVERSSHALPLGFQDEDALIALYALADAFVLPSHDEPWGVVVNEALACGTPVVVTDAVGAAEDLVVDGVNGRIVPAGDVAALAAALRAPHPRPVGPGRIDGWTYAFAVEQFLDGINLAVRPAA